MPAALRISQFGPNDPLGQLPASNQVAYVRYYLADLGAKSVVEEPNYFDRDYLAEFSAFYSTSARPYGNRCRRLHFFSTAVHRANLKSAAGGSRRGLQRLQDAYLGFVVVRPIPARLGRVVLKWYRDPFPSTPRVIEPARLYDCHVAGFTLSVRGLAWQQQDSAVGGCATIALWSLLHSSAFDDAHAIPTTADITRFAHRTASLGARIFPSHGLTRNQMLEAIKEAGLAPMCLDGEKQLPNGVRAFSKERFASSCAALLRSGYPVILTGHFLKAPVTKHAVCVAGFREAPAPMASPTARSPGRVDLQDEGIHRLYVHDDNIGPNVRFDVAEQRIPLTRRKSVDVVVVRRAKPKPPTHSWPDHTYPGYPPFMPDAIVAAVHDGLRTSPDALHKLGMDCAEVFRDELASYAIHAGVTLSTRFTKFPAYQQELGKLLASTPRALSSARLALAEQEPPMSLHLGVVRLGTGPTPHVDLLIDTTDTDLALRPFCYVAYSSGAAGIVAEMNKRGTVEWGNAIRAY